jgi:hypothetical protein
MPAWKVPTVTTAVSRRHVTGDDTLQGHHQRRAGENGIDRAVRVSAVAAVAGNGYLDGIRRRHKVAGVEAQLADRQPGHIVQRKHAIAGEALKQPVFYHQVRAADASSAGWKMTCTVPLNWQAGEAIYLAAASRWCGRRGRRRAFSRHGAGPG